MSRLVQLYGPKGWIALGLAALLIAVLPSMMSSY